MGAKHSNLRALYCSRSQSFGPQSRRVNEWPVSGLPKVRLNGGYVRDSGRSLLQMNFRTDGQAGPQHCKFGLLRVEPDANRYPLDDLGEIA